MLGSLNVHLKEDNSFDEGFYSPDCVSILFDCINNVAKHSFEIFSETEETKNCHHLLK